MYQPKKKHFFHVYFANGRTSGKGTAGVWPPWCSVGTD